MPSFEQDHFFLLELANIFEPLSSHHFDVLKRGRFCGPLPFVRVGWNIIVVCDPLD